MLNIPNDNNKFHEYAGFDLAAEKRKLARDLYHMRLNRDHWQHEYRLLVRFTGHDEEVEPTELW